MLIDLDALASEAHRLEPLPVSVVRLLGVLGLEDWQVSDVEEVVRLDPTLTGRVLSMANSAFCGAVRRVSTVKDAVVRLGASSVVGLAMALATKDHLQRPLEPYGAKAGDLWRHSVATLLAAEEMIPRTGAAPGVVTAGLLHDIGKLFLCQHADPSAWRHIELAERAGGLGRVRAELEILEVHHGELGGLIGQRWGLPEDVVAAIVHHHDPESAAAERHRTSCRVVYLADRIAHHVGCAPGESQAEEADPDPAVLAGVGLSPELFRDLCDRVAMRLEATLEAYA